MSFAGISYLAVFVAALAGWLAGAAYYNAVATPWVAAHGKSMEEFKRQAEAAKGTPGAWMPYALAFVAELVMAWVLAGLLGHLGGPEEVTIWNGIVSAAFVWLGFVVTTVGVNNMFGMRKPMLTVIDAAHWLLMLVLMGAIIGAFGT
jgi:hypothetical protein